MIHIEREYINLNRKIDINAWERFEELADTKERLWHIFWTISKDKDEIKTNNICKNFYFHRFVLSELYEPLHSLTINRIVNKKDIEIIFSLYLKMIPDCECNECRDESNLAKNVSIRENSEN